MTNSGGLASQRRFLRLGLAGAGALLLHTSLAVLFTAPTVSAPFNALIVVGCGLTGLLLIAMAALRRPDDRLRWLILLAFLLDLLCSGASWIQTSGANWVGTALPNWAQIDSAVYSDMAGELLLRGRNPYVWDYSAAMSFYREGSTTATPTLAGAQESPFPYPSLNFLLTVPFLFIGLPGTFCVILLAHLATLITVFCIAPRAYQPLTLLPLALGVSFNFTTLSFIGVQDVVWIFFVLLIIVCWRRWLFCGLWFGLAMAFKQSPWILVPFLLLRIAFDDDEKTGLSSSLLQFVFVSAITFFVLNGPFLLNDPVAWWRGVTEPLRDSLIFISQGGLSGLAQYGIINLPKSYFLIASLSILGLLLIIYARHYRILRDAVWMLPGVFLWFSYRSLVTYWVFGLFPLLATLARGTASIAKSSLNPWRGWRLTVALSGAVLAALLVLGIVMGSRPLPIQLQVQVPVTVGDAGRIGSLNIEVNNQSTQPLTPRFATQNSQTYGNSVYWQIASGPLVLGPAQTAMYEIRPAHENDSFYVFDTALLMVTDAGENYDLRGVTTFAGDRSFLWPDAIANASFRFWNNTREGPIYWLPHTDDTSKTVLSMVHTSERDALQMTLDAKTSGTHRADIETQMLFPMKPMTFSVYPSPAIAASAQTTFGIEIDDGDHLLWFTFGQSPYARVNPADHIVEVPLPADQWSNVVLDLPNVYKQLGWSLPSLRKTVYQGVEADFRPIHLSVFIVGEQGKWTVAFGPIQQPPPDRPQDRMAEILRDPKRYYQRLGDELLDAGNYLRAIEAYRYGLHYVPDDISLQSRLNTAIRYRDQEYAR